MKSYRYFISLIVLVGTLISNTSYASNTYRAGEVIYGREYNDILQDWIDRTFTMWVGVSKKNTKTFYFQAETGLGNATVWVDDLNGGPDLVRDLEKAISKAIEWSNIAKKNKADVTKGLDCFGWKPSEDAKENGYAFRKNQMGLRFSASNGGTQSFLIIDIIDSSNQFKKTEIYLNTTEMKKLLNAVRSTDKPFQKAKEQSEKSNLFK